MTSSWSGAATGRFSRRFILAILLLGLAASPAYAEDTWTGVERIVAVGDVHGDFDQFIKLLRSVRLIDEDLKWSGGRTHLVQTGDVPDRGPGSRKVMDLLMNLEKQARKQGGYVHPLIGNHEAMNVYGDLRYIHPGEYEAFRGPASASTRDRYYDLHVEELEANPPPEGLPAFDEAYRQKWNEEHPLGYFEHRQAFGERGKYGRWIRRHNAVIRINGTVFLHGGIGPKYASHGITDINKQIRAELEDFSKIRGGMAIDPAGPLWYRGLAQETGEPIQAHLEALLDRLGAERIVIGHTVTIGTVMPRFDGRVVMIDVGLSSYYGGRLACLIIDGGGAHSLHRGHRFPLPSTRSQLLDYLTGAARLDPQPSPLLATIEKLQQLAGGGD